MARTEYLQESESEQYYLDYYYRYRDGVSSGWYRAKTTPGTRENCFLLLETMEKSKQVEYCDVMLMKQTIRQEIDTKYDNSRFTTAPQ